MENKVANTSGSEDSDDEPLAKIVKRTREQQSDESSSASGNNVASGKNTQSETPKAKLLTAFAHFFNDTQQSIRKKNATATFEEVSRIVMSMWQSLDANTKLIYHRKEEEDKARLEESLHDIVPTLLQKASTPKPVSSTGQTSVQSKLPAIVSAKTSEGSSVAQTIPPIVSKAISVQSRPAKVISLSACNKIVVTTKPVSSLSVAAKPPGSTSVTSKPTGSTSVAAKPPGSLFVVAKPSNGSLISVTGVSILEKPNTSATSTRDQPTTSTEQEIVSPDMTSKHSLMDTNPPPTTSVAASEPVTAVPTTASNVTPTTALSTTPTIAQKLAEKTQQSAGTTKKVRRRRSSASPQPKICKNSSCENMSIKHKKWEEDFCCPKCVVEHCREQFAAWVSARN